MTRFQQLMALRERFEKRNDLRDDVIFATVFTIAGIILVLVIYFIAWEVFA